MGLATSFLLGKGSPTTQVVNVITGSLYNSFITKETSTFPEFHKAFLDIYNTFNSALPGKHYDVPTNQEIESCYNKWTEAHTEKEKKEIFLKFISSTVSLNKPQKMTLITGLVTPPAAMVAKKAGERVPALKVIKVIPDVLFVPTFTFLGLISAQVSRNMLHRRMVSRKQQREQQDNNGTNNNKENSKESNKESNKEREKEKGKESSSSSSSKESNKTP